MERKQDFGQGWFFHRGELRNPPCKVNSKTGTCGGASNLTEEEGFRFRLHPYMAAKMRVDYANHLYNVAKALEEDWMPVCLPHDWTAGLVPTPPEQWANTTQAVESGYLQAGVGYYRKRFCLPAESLGKRILLEFEGVMRDSTVWVNGCYVGSHLSGYTGFALDISEYVFYGDEGENVVLVKADTAIREGWWAEGAGIYRPVSLYTLEPVHFDRHGVFVFTESIARNIAAIQTQARIKNMGDDTADVVLTQSIYSPDGRLAAQGRAKAQVGSLEDAVVSIPLKVNGPALWEPDSPRLYTLKSAITVAGSLVDEITTAFGIREVTYTPEGLRLNGRILEIKGVCVHQDFAGVGSALTPDILRYMLQRIKSMGANCCRSAHHPASRQLLEACDEMGILVLNENRRFELSRDSMEDLEDLILGARNHPCVFMWSLENEELMPTLPNGKRLLKELVRRVHKLDPTRQCTVAGHFACRDAEYVKIPDVAGFNYDMDDAAAMREAVPGLLTMASEDGSYVSTRGEYADDAQKSYCDCYDSGSYLMKMMMKQMGLAELPVGTLGGASSPNNLVYSWNQYRRKAPFLGGMFLWAAFDYRGETFPWNWPAVTSQYGAMDWCGFEKDSFYYWKCLWQAEPLVHLLPHWNWEQGQTVQVDAYTNCDEVELFLNNVSLGRKRHEPGSISTWRVSYQPGAIKAVAYRNGQAVAEDAQATAGSEAYIDLKLLYEGETQVLYQASILDENGALCPKARVPLAFSATNGRVVGTGNGDPAHHAACNSSSCDTFHGLALIIVEKTGPGLPTLTAERIV